MDKFLENIDRQIRSNQDKNLFFDDPGIFRFTGETIQSFQDIDELDSDSKQCLLDYTTDKVIEEFCRVNQYYSFASEARKDLRTIYTELYECSRISRTSTDEISRIHFRNLRAWLLKYNPFAEKVYQNNNGKLAPVACSEYSQALQTDILSIDIGNLMEPVLDIGCGKSGYLVRHLSEKGIDVLGIDRFSFSEPGFETADWLEFDYGINAWGTVISNLGFSNHFNHHNQREDGDFINYAKTYMIVLQSLKVGGSFHYAPDLPFIEIYLDKRQFSVNKHDLPGYDFRSAVVTRLK